MYHGKDFQYTFINSAGEKVVAGIEQIGNGQYVRSIPLIPDTYLERIIKFWEDKNLQEGLSSFYGHVSEYAVRDTLMNQGYQVFIPASSNTPGYDLCVEKRFFDNYGLDYVENPDMPGYGLLQVKSTIKEDVIDCTENTLRHFEKYPDIPVVASTRIVEEMNGFDEGKLISFKDIEIPEKALQESVRYHFDPVTDKFLPETLNVYREGLDSIHFSDVMDDSIDGLTFADFSEGAIWDHLHIPAFGIAIAAGISSYKQYRMVKDNQISWARASVNIAKDTGKTAVISTTTIGLTSLTAGAIGISATESANGIAEWAFSDADLDLSDVGELGLYIAIAAGIGCCVKKLWNWILFLPGRLKRFHRGNRQLLRFQILLFTGAPS